MTCVLFPLAEIKFLLKEIEFTFNVHIENQNGWRNFFYFFETVARKCDAASPQELKGGGELQLALHGSVIKGTSHVVGPQTYSFCQRNAERATHAHIIQKQEADWGSRKLKPH